MPRGDGTGPMGAGPMTGRALGFCAGYSVPGFANPVGLGRGRGMAYGRGGGGGLGMAYRRGMGRGFGFAAWPAAAAQAQPIDEATALKSQMEVLEQQLSAIKQRLGEIESGEES